MQLLAMGYKQCLHVWRVDKDTGDVFNWEIQSGLSPRDDGLSQMENHHRFMANRATTTFWDFNDDDLPWEPPIQE